jgi:hypothetical protein
MYVSVSVATLEHEWAECIHLTTFKTLQKDSSSQSVPKALREEGGVSGFLFWRGILLLSYITASGTLIHPNGLDPLTIRAENAGWDLLRDQSFRFFSLLLGISHYIFLSLQDIIHKKAQEIRIEELDFLTHIIHQRIRWRTREKR